jgi:lon-related putative ATP-dependent protease
MNIIKPLSIKKLRWVCNSKDLGFKTTSDLKTIESILGQERAINALKFGTSITHDGYNIFALGSKGMDKHSIVLRFLENKAEVETPPSDWCYVHNFVDPNKPLALKLPSGRGLEFKENMLVLSEDIQQGLHNAFDSKEYQTRFDLIGKKMRDKQQNLISKIEVEAEKKSIGVTLSSLGIIFVPLSDGEEIPPDEYKKLTKRKQKDFEENIRKLQKKFDKVLQQVPSFLKEDQEQRKRLNEETVRYAINHPVEELQEKYKEIPDVVSYLQALYSDIIKSVTFLTVAADQSVFEKEGNFSFSIQPYYYQVNLLVDNSSTKRSPVIYDDDPSYDHLLGRIEHSSEMGMLVTDFNLIRSGTLHEANGGYLVVDIIKLLTSPLAYEGLKDALKAKEIRIKPMGHALGFSTMRTLEPEPIPLSVKVILVGDRSFYYLLSAIDSEFSALFKVAADFEEDMDRKPSTLKLYSRMIATLIKKENLKPFTCKAVASVLEYSARLVGDREKLSTHFETIADLLREANFLAKQNSSKQVKHQDISKAIAMQEERQGRLRENLLEATQRGIILIDTKGAKIGQVNGLSIIDLGSCTFGHPNRITARVSIGSGQIIDIEREVKLGGPIHSKGVMILRGYLQSHYLTDKPFSLRASLVFEQSYEGIEGDSASLAELCTLLSAIAAVPLRQDLALTGSVNQQGQIQAIGGVNEKIEGFFDLCNARGLSGTQGVLIPKSNIKHLMLDQRVIDAVENKKFHIYTIDTVDQAIQVLTDMTAGKKKSDNNFTKGSFNDLVQKRLELFAENQKGYNSNNEKI